MMEFVLALPDGEWRVPYLSILAAAIIAAIIAAIRRESALVIGGFIFVAVVAGAYAARAMPEAQAGVIGNFFESDGRRAIREAEAERIRSEARTASLRVTLDAERQRALLAASSIRHAAPASGRESSVAVALVFALFALAFASFALVFALLRERRKREAMGRAIAEMRFRIALAENSRRSDEEFMGTFRLPLQFRELARKEGS